MNIKTILKGELFGIIVLVGSIIELFSSIGPASIVLAGIAVLLGALVFFLILCGAIGELVVKTADKGIHRSFIASAWEVLSDVPPKNES